MVALWKVYRDLVDFIVVQMKIMKVIKSVSCHKLPNIRKAQCWVLTSMRSSQAARGHYKQNINAKERLNF